MFPITYLSILNTRVNGLVLQFQIFKIYVAMYNEYAMNAFSKCIVILSKLRLTIQTVNITAGGNVAFMEPFIYVALFRLFIQTNRKPQSINIRSL